MILDCHGLTSVGGGALTLDRDNTGVGAEALSSVVTDGKGTVLFVENVSIPLGGPYDAVSTGFFPYVKAPKYNPITLQFISHAGNGLPQQVVTVAVGECEGLPWVAQPGYPDEFEQRVITCDVPVYDAPGGKPVGDDALKAGQTWYVNPTPVDGPDGQPWSEVYVGGWQRPFIPTACVGG